MNLHINLSPLGMVLNDPYLEAISARIAKLDNAMLDGSLSPEFILGGLDAILDGSLVARDFPVWKTVRYPENVTRTFQQVFDVERISEFCYGQAAQAQKKLMLMYHPFVALRAYFHYEREKPHLSEVDLVCVNASDLGFKGYRKVKVSHLYTRALELGLHYCPVDFAFLLRAAYLDQPKGEWLIVALNEWNNPETAGQDQMVLGRGNDDTLQLTCRVNRTSVPVDQKFIWSKPRKGEGK